MATFRVGQRVRKVRNNPTVRNSSTFIPAPLGSQGTIIEIGPISCIFDQTAEYLISWDCKQKLSGAEGFQLEPITDTGRQVIDWDAVCWKPPHLREFTKEKVS